MSQSQGAAGASTNERSSSLAALSNGQFDLIVIGAGIAGACTAWDAAMRGVKVALLEQADFGGSTSAQSLKVLHGGIRYLQHLDIVRLRESCAERAAFLRIAPHLTRPLPFALPTYGFGMRGKMPLRAAFALLNVFTAGRNRGTANRGQHIPAPFILSRREFLDKFPAFDDPSLTGAGVFYDGQMLNPPRIVYAVVRAAQAASAIALNYAPVEGLLQRDGRVEGVTVRDAATGNVFDVRAKIVANMTGPYAPAFLKKATAGVRLDVPLSRDMAIVVNKRLLPGIGIGIQTKYKDPDAWLSRGNRHLFLAPWRNYTLIGVHSRIYKGDPFDLTVTEAEVQGFIDEVREACPALGVTRHDVVVVNAGLLPFGENDPDSKDLSFGKRSVLVDHGAEGGPDGLFSGMSVRWTMGRLLAEKTVDRIAARLGAAGRRCATASTPVHGGAVDDRGELLRAIAARAGAGAPDGAVAHLADTFGALWSDALNQPEGCSLLPGAEIFAGEVRHAARNEMAVTLNDIVLRRLDLGTGAVLNLETLEACARIAGEELGWNEQRRRSEIRNVSQSYPFANPVSQQYLSS